MARDRRTAASPVSRPATRRVEWSNVRHRGQEMSAHWWRIDRLRFETTIQCEAAARTGNCLASLLENLQRTPRIGTTAARYLPWSAEWLTTPSRLQPPTLTAVVVPIALPPAIGHAAATPGGSTRERVSAALRAAERN